MKIVGVCFLTMGHILYREAVSASAQCLDVPLGMCGCAFQQVGLILKRKTWTCFNLKLIWQRVEMVLGKSVFDPGAACVLIRSSTLAGYEVPRREVEWKTFPPLVLMEAVPVYTCWGCDPVFLKAFC